MSPLSIIHVRSNRYEAAAIRVTDEAKAKAAQLALLGIELRIRQIPPDEVTEAAQTVGVDSPAPNAQRIEVALVHRRGTIKALWCYNEAGDNSPVKTAEKLITSITQEEISVWLQTNV